LDKFKYPLRLSAKDKMYMKTNNKKCADFLKRLIFSFNKYLRKKEIENKCSSSYYGKI
jgi:hypothetical protein